MKKAHILHNPNAGKGEYTKKELIAILESQGYECGYSSTKEKGWKDFDKNVDLIVIAGGDGTVRKVAVKALAKSKDPNPPIALLPLGTANNISKSLGIAGHAKEIISDMSADKKRQFDVGRLKGLPEKTIFLESFGYGIFPQLMHVMKENPVEETVTPAEEIKIALERTHQLALEFPAQHFDIRIDGNDHSGMYIMVEVMNISSIGPNLGLSPNSDPGDGEFELVLIPETQRQEFANYVTGKINDAPVTFIPRIVKGSDITIASEAALLHIDDELVDETESASVTIRPDRGVLEFLVQ